MIAPWSNQPKLRQFHTWFFDVCSYQVVKSWQITTTNSTSSPMIHSTFNKAQNRFNQYISALKKYHTSMYSRSELYVPVVVPVPQSLWGKTQNYLKQQKLKARQHRLLMRLIYLYQASAGSAVQPHYTLHAATHYPGYCQSKSIFTAYHESTALS